MALLRVPIYPTRNLATEIDPGARTIVAGTNVSFVVNPDGSITINASGGGTGTVTSVGLAAPTGFTVSGSPVTTSGTLTFAYAAGYTGYTTAEQTKLAGIAPGAQPGTVTSVGATGSTGLTVGGSPITTSGTLTFTLSANLQSWSGIAPSSKADTSDLANYVTLATAQNISGSKVFTNGAVRVQGWSGDPTGGVLYLGDAATDAYIHRPGGLQQLNFKYGTGTAVLNATGTILTTANITAAVGATYVNVAGDTMTGTLTLAASYGLRFSGAAGGRLRILDDSGVPSLQWVNAAETTFSIGRYVATEHRFSGGTLDAYAGFRSFNAQQVKVYDNNNDTPIELGLGYTGPADRNGYLWNRNNGWLSLGTNNVERMRIQAGGNIVTTGGAFIVQDNDIYTYRAGGTSGVIFLTAAGTRYLFFDGSRYEMPGAPLALTGGGIDAAGTIQSSTRAVTGLLGGEGFQVVWNTVQPGQGRTEYVNNRGGGAGGFTWWDRANTGAGTGTALATLTGAGLFVNGVAQIATGSTSVAQIGAWPINANYVALTNTGMGGSEYVLLTANPAIDTATYISSAVGGVVNIRPGANSLTGQVTFSASNVTSAVPYIDNTGYNVRRIAPVVLNNTQNLDSSHLNKVVEKSNTSNYTYTIPSGLGAHGDCITILNGNNSGTITIARAGGVSLYRNGLDANITVNPGNMVTIMRTSNSDRWQA